MNRKIKTALLVGTGAVGSLYGGKLSQAGVEVAALCRSNFQVVKEKGISVSSVWGDFHFSPKPVARRSEEMESHPDLILVALKFLPRIDVPAIIRGTVGPDTAILLLQNGVEIEESVVSAFPENEIISGLAFVCVSRLAPGRVDHIDYGRLVIGNYPSGVSNRTEELARLFNGVGVPCKASEDVVMERWKKLVWNAPFNTISVLGGGLDTKEIVGCQESERLVIKVMEEVCLVAGAMGHRLPPSVVKENMDATFNMKPYKPSMCLDFEAGRPMEVEGILGNAARAARRGSVPVPHLETLYALLQLADRARP